MSDSSRISTGAARKVRGHLKVFLGYAAGVGKTYQMLVEAQALKARGVDVVIGYFEPHGRLETIAQTEGLEVVPRARVPYRGAELEEMDTEAIIRRHPQVCAVDEFAHTNVPGSPRAKRWEDVLAIRDAGIDVLTTLNIQHLESLNDQVWQVTGVRVRETVPDWVFREADEVVMVDVTTRALIHRLERGVVYKPEAARRALENFFTEANLTALRELALRQTAHQIEVITESESPHPTKAEDLPSGERVLLWLTGDPRNATLIRRGRRVSDFLRAECVAVGVAHPKESTAEKVGRERHLNFARNMGIQAETIESNEPARAVADYARQHGITQIYVNRTVPQLHQLVHSVRDLQVTIVADRVR